MACAKDSERFGAVVSPVLTLPLPEIEYWERTCGNATRQGHCRCRALRPTNLPTTSPMMNTPVNKTRGQWKARQRNAKKRPKHRLARVNRKKYINDSFDETLSPTSRKANMPAPQKIPPNAAYIHSLAVPIGYLKALGFLCTTAF